MNCPDSVDVAPAVWVNPRLIAFPIVVEIVRAIFLRIPQTHDNEIPLTPSFVILTFVPTSVLFPGRTNEHAWGALRLEPAVGVTSSKRLSNMASRSSSFVSSASVGDYVVPGTQNSVKGRKKLCCDAVKSPRFRGPGETVRSPRILRCPKCH